MDIAHVQELNIDVEDNYGFELAEEGVVEFKATHKQDKKLFSIYFDFECLTVPIESPENDPDKSSTLKYQSHVPCGFCIVTTSVFDSYEKVCKVFSDSDPKKVTQEFFVQLTSIYEDMMTCYKKNQKPIDMSEQDEVNFKKSTTCHICKKSLDWKSEKNYPVRDHDHTKEKNNFRGAAHKSCNINYFNRTKKVPVFAHNLKGYDMQLILRDLIKNFEKIDIIPENIEKFKAVFTESFIFMEGGI